MALETVTLYRFNGGPAVSASAALKAVNQQLQHIRTEISKLLCKGDFTDDDVRLLATDEGEALVAKLAELQADRDQLNSIIGIK